VETLLPNAAVKTPMSADTTPSKERPAKAPVAEEKEEMKPVPKAALPAGGGLAIGGVKFEGLPTGGKVRVDGNWVPSPNAVQYLPAGKHQYIADAKGFLPEEADFQVAVGEVKSVGVALKPKPTEPKGTVEINCTPWCQITVDGKDTGKTSPASLSLNVGSHTLFLANPPAGLAKKFQVKVTQGAVVRQVVKLEE
jgi:hypothetical protein